MKTEIRAFTINLNDIYGVYGFGSFFRRAEFNDVDLLLVTAEQCEDSLQAYHHFTEYLRAIANKHNITFDVTPLTYTEYISNPPLKEIDQLYELYKAALR